MKNNISASRQSNFELLRIVAILMVIMHHLIIKSAQTCGYTHTFDLEHDGYIGLIFNSLFVGGGKYLPTHQRMVWYQKNRTANYKAHI